MESIALTTSFRYCSRRVIIHVTGDALQCWGARGDQASLFATFSQRAQDIQSLAFEMAAADSHLTQVLVDAALVQSRRDALP